MTATWTVPTAASHPASPSARPGPGSPAGRSGGWSAPVPGEDRWKGERGRLLSPHQPSVLQGKCSQCTRDGLGQAVQRSWAVTEGPGLLSPGIKARYGSTRLDNLEMIQDTYNSGSCCQESLVVGKEEERGREERWKGLQLSPHLKAAFSTSSVKYLSVYHRSGNISPYMVT